MKYLLAAVLLSGLFFTFSIHTAYAQISGGYTKSGVDNVEVANAANFAMKTKEEALRKEDKGTNVSLVEIVVWKKLDGEYELSSWNYRKEEKKE